MQEAMFSKSLLDCASKCQKYETKFGLCNAFSFEEDSELCNLAKVDFNPIQYLYHFSFFLFQLIYLEDPEVGKEPKSMMISADVIDVLKMYCRGGTNCCGKESNRLCGEGEGDCDHDDQCSGWS